MDREEFREEVRIRLKGKSKEQQVAFAVRSAMRMLPLLAVQEGSRDLSANKREAFEFWRTKDKNRFLLSVFKDLYRKH
ncbi:hypothetical protein KFZ76_20615 [Methylovulum psychrotolerans]|uniref:hypothetical protein n=1 Tax=Methylovulum psychrotolerans TaxID=1704499 RepID=UPI001BFF3CEC|nr:hypothetical protein [Methylovulum psychrotolerans]MBT9100110.1 hypothetical protein [Methylovulum psychrotolerans]